MGTNISMYESINICKREPETAVKFSFGAACSLLSLAYGGYGPNFKGGQNLFKAHCGSDSLRLKRSAGGPAH
jgi:hypothetical protein